MKIAVIGSGIAGNVAARHLHREHDITVYESQSHVGGHVHTHDVEHEGNRFSIDTGFIVFNDWTYPNFISLLDELGVESEPTQMSFSSRCMSSGIEYNGTSLNGLFSQRRNLINPRFHGMIADILRFNRKARKLLNDGNNHELTLGDYLDNEAYGQMFRDNYIIPMGAAIWSTDPQQMLEYPARQFVRFFVNHGLLNIIDRPQWRVIKGGSREYVRKLTRPFRHRIATNRPVCGVLRHNTHVDVLDAHGGRESYDHVFLACHSDQALALLKDPGLEEKAILGAIPYQSNLAVLHTDTSVLPANRRSWAAWNYLRRGHRGERVTLTYNMNILQHIEAEDTFCVTLNDPENIDPDKVIASMEYDHPLFTPAGTRAQQRQHEINGNRRTWFCGAYWRYGFHEDGVVSALDTIRQFNEYVQHEQPPLLRTA